MYMYEIGFMKLLTCIDRFCQNHFHQGGITRVLRIQ